MAPKLAREQQEAAMAALKVGQEVHLSVRHPGGDEMKHRTKVVTADATAKSWALQFLEGELKGKQVTLPETGAFDVVTLTTSSNAEVSALMARAAASPILDILDISSWPKVLTQPQGKYIIMQNLRSAINFPFSYTPHRTAPSDVGKCGYPILEKLDYIEIELTRILGLTEEGQRDRTNWRLVEVMLGDLMGNAAIRRGQSGESWMTIFQSNIADGSLRKAVLTANEKATGKK